MDNTSNYIEGLEILDKYTDLVDIKFSLMPREFVATLQFNKLQLCAGLHPEDLEDLETLGFLVNVRACLSYPLIHRTYVTYYFY